MSAPTICPTDTRIVLDVPEQMLSDVFAAVADVAVLHGMRTVLVSVGDGISVRVVEWA